MSFKPFPKPAASWLAALACAAAGASLAQTAPAAAIAERQANFKAVAADFRLANEQLRRTSPDMAVLRGASKRLNQAAKDLPKWFAQGTGPESGAPTAAKSEIWSNPTGFSTASKTLLTEAGKFEKLTRGKDLEAMKVQVKALGAECAACHNDFRGQIAPAPAP